MTINKTMKGLRFIVAILAVCVLTGCRTTEKFTVNGTPGTEVYTPEKQPIGTIGSNGKLKVKLPSDNYCGFLYTHQRSSNLWVPFGLDFKSRNRKNADDAGEVIGYTSFIMGMGGLITGSVMLIGGDDSGVGLGICGGGAVLGLGGALLGAAYKGKGSQITHQYNFSYLDQQTTNQDMHFTSYVPPVQASAVSTSDSDKKIKLRTSQSGKQPKGKSTKGKGKSSKLKLQLANAAEKVSGTYGGSGAAYSNGKSVADFDEMEITIERVNDDMVRIQLYYDGEPLFSTEEIYSVTRKKDGSYVLRHKEVTDAVINISAKGSLTYRHPSVEFEDGDKYVFTIKAVKK